MQREKYIGFKRLSLASLLASLIITEINFPIPSLSSSREAVLVLLAVLVAGVLFQRRALGC